MLAAGRRGHDYEVECAVCTYIIIFLKWVYRYIRRLKQQ